MSAEVFPEVPAGALLQAPVLPSPPTAPPVSRADALQPASVEQELRSSGLLLGMLVFVVLLGVGLGLLAGVVGGSVQP